MRLGFLGGVEKSLSTGNAVPVPMDPIHPFIGAKTVTLLGGKTPNSMHLSRKMPADSEHEDLNISSTPMVYLSGLKSIGHASSVIFDDDLFNQRYYIRFDRVLRKNSVVMGPVWSASS